MQLGETIATYDVALALRGENGKFEVTSPTGEVYHVTCKPNHSISNLEWSGNKTEAQPFLIRKVAEPISTESGKVATSGTLEVGGQTRSVRTPFLLGDQDGNSKPGGDMIIPLPRALQDGFQSLEAGDPELFYSESDQKTKQPAAFVYLKSGRQNLADKPEQRMTAVCANFNEFDAEIRKLQGKLDQIRSRARKKFYKAQAAAASA